MPKEIKGIVRIAGTDIKGEERLFVSLQKIKGVGASFANAICEVSGLDYKKKVGTLTNREVKKIESIMKDPKKFDLPTWLMNRREEPVSGENVHIIDPELRLIQKQDIERLKRIKSYKGVRHSLGLPVRGQRTKSTGRRGVTVGVVRKKAKARLREKKKEAMK